MKLWKWKRKKQNKQTNKKKTNKNKTMKSSMTFLRKRQDQNKYQIIITNKLKEEKTPNIVFICLKSLPTASTPFEKTIAFLNTLWFAHWLCASHMTTAFIKRTYPAIIWHCLRARRHKHTHTARHFYMDGPLTMSVSVFLCLFDGRDRLVWLSLEIDCLIVYLIAIGVFGSLELTDSEQSGKKWSKSVFIPWRHRLVSINLIIHERWVLAT